MKIKIEWKNIKIPILRFYRDSSVSFPIADNVGFGSIVITRHGWDVGFVLETLEGSPIKILSRYTGIHPTPLYGGRNIAWYDTGERMTLPEWMELGVRTDATGFHNYWKERLRLGR